MSTVRARGALALDAPFESSTVTITWKTPATDGVQLTVEAFAEPHPGGSPDQTYPRLPDPPATVARRVSGSPARPGAADDAGTATVGGRSTGNERRAEALAPFESLTVAESENSPAAAGAHESEIESCVAHPVGRFVQTYEYLDVPPDTRSAVKTTT